ncbi:MAG TPA: SLBB domain-containing protein [Armatimonadota bacterium]|nr:SLBB domain-containing protein [Armatimonadota bacterium]
MTKTILYSLTALLLTLSIGAPPAPAANSLDGSGTGGLNAPATPGDNLPQSVQVENSVVPAPVDYRLQPGDILNIQVLNPGAIQFSSDVAVQEDNKARLPIQPPVLMNAGGLTIDQFHAVATRLYSRFIRDPILLVTLKSYHQPNIYIFGDVNRAGAVTLRPPMRVLDLIGISGAGTNADLSRVKLTRGNKSRVLNIKSVLNSADERDNIELQPGDRIFVPVLDEHVTVQGEVGHPSSIPFSTGMSAEDAIFAAGGPLAQSDLSQVLVQRGSEPPVHVDLNSVILAGGRDLTTLKPGDVITVPQAPENILVFGEVTHPAPVPYRPGITLDQALALAGGETPDADLSDITIAHAKTAAIDTIDLTKAQQSGTTSQITLQPGDTISIPKQTAHVLLLGVVAHPGDVPFHDGMTLLDAIDEAAGNLTLASNGPGESPDLYHVLVTHSDGTTTTVDMDKVIRHGDTADNIKLSPGDTIYVPASTRVVYVFGAVGRPGAYALPENDKNRVLDAIALAGGTAANADTGKAQLIQSVGGKPVQTPLHLNDVTKHGDMNYNIPLEAGDVIFIPQHGQTGDIMQKALPYLLALPTLMRL